jgi:DNA-binding MarR family transcriptional regulator
MSETCYGTCTKVHLDADEGRIAVPERAFTVSPCHCLTMRQASRQITQLYDQHFAPTGLRVTQYSVLRVLGRHEPIAMQALADRMVMDRTTLSRALRPLERDGLVSMAPGRDARTRLLSLTPAGHDLLDALTPTWNRAQAEFEIRFGGAETQDLRGMLSRVVAQFA